MRGSTCRAQPWSVLYREGKRQRRVGREKKLASGHVQVDWMETNFEWRRLFPAQQNSMARSAPQTYTTVPGHKAFTWSFGFESFHCRIHLLRCSMSHGQLLLRPLSKEKDLPEFQSFGTKEPLWKTKKPKMVVFILPGISLHWKHLNYITKVHGKKSSTVRVSQHCTLSLKTQPSG